MVRKALALLVSATLVSACSIGGGEGSESSSKTEKTDKTAALPTAEAQDFVSSEWVVDDSPVSQPVVIDGVVAVLVKSGKSLEAVAFDAKSGDELWRQPAHPGLQAPGVVPSITKVNGSFAFHAPVFSDVWMSRNITVRPRDGQTLSQSSRQRWYGLEACGDDMCSTAFDAEGAATRYRISSSSEEETEDRAVPAGSQKVGGGLHLNQGAEGEDDTIYRLDDDEELWSADSSQLVSSNSTSRTGWYFTDPDAAEHVATISLGSRRGESLPQRDWRSLNQDNLQVGVDKRTGKRLWERRGYTNLCAPNVDLDEWPIRCRTTGEGRMDPATGEWETRNTKTTFEGFDPESGDATWTADIGSSQSWSDTKFMVVLGRDWVAFDTDDGRRALNLSSGKVDTPETELVGACSEASYWTFEEPYSDDPDDTGRRVGTEVVTPCSEEEGADADPQALPAGVLSHVGVEDDNRYFVVTDSGLAAYTEGDG